MGLTLDVIRTLTIKAMTDGFEEAISKQDELARSNQNLGVVSENTSKVTESTSKSFARLNNTYNESAAGIARAQKAEADLQKAMAQGLGTSEQYREIHAGIMKQLEGSHTQMTKMAEVTALVESKMINAGASVGMIGELFQIIGLKGIVAAAGIGAVVVAGHELLASANAAAEWARRLADSAESIGVTTTQLQGLETVAATAGVSSDQFTTSMVRMQREMSMLQEGGGTLFKVLSHGNTELLAQLSVTKDSATQVNILAKAYVGLTDAQQKLIQQGFGRGEEGAAFGRALKSINSGGGTDGAVSGNALDAISTANIEKWKELSIAIQIASESATHNFQSMFSTDVLEAEKGFYEGLLAISRAAKAFAVSDDWLKFYGFKTPDNKSTGLGQATNALGAVGAGITAGAATGAMVGALGGPVGAVGGAVIGAGAAAFAVAVTEFGTYTKTLEAKALEDGSGFKHPTPGDQGFKGPSGNEHDLEATTASLGVQATLAAKLVSELGSAATAEEKFAATVAKANALAEHGTDIEKATALRMKETAGIERDAAQQAAYNTVMGASLSIEEQVITKRAELNRLMKDAKGATQDDIDKTVELYKRQQEGTFQMDAAADATGVSTRAMFMAAGEAAAYTAKQTELNKALQNGKPVTDAWLASLTKSSDALGIAKQKAADLTQIWQFASGSIDSVASTMSQIGTGTVTMSAGFKQLGISVAASLEQIIVKMLLMKALQASLGPILGAFGGGSSAVGNPTAIGGLYHTGGIVGSEPTSTSAVSMAMFAGAPRFHSGGIVGNEVPIIAKQGEGVFTPGQMAAMGGGSNVQINVINNADGTKAETKKTHEGGVDIHTIIISAVDQHAASGGLDKVMKTRYATPMRTRGR